MLSERQIDELIERLDYSEGTGTGSYWQMLKHAEKNDFDIAAIKSAVHATLMHDLYDMPKPESDADERELVLALRDRMRREMLLAPLSEEERSRWRWDAPESLRQYRYTGPTTMNDQPGLSTDEINVVARIVRSKYPEVARYLKAVRAHNEPLGGNGGPNDHLIVRQAWHYPFTMDAICDVIGETGSVALFRSLRDIEQALIA